MLDTLPLLDPESAEYPLLVLTLVESILENPEVILRKQLDRVKGDAIVEMKMKGMDYDARMEELEKLEYPKPNREFIYSTFNAFADKHPWVGEENIKPKSIVREMFEEFRSFADYIKDYELHRSEGILLRHLSSVHKVLAQTVPDSAKTDTVREMELYLGTMIRQVDSSLLDEWEKMRDPNYQAAEKTELRPPGYEESLRDITRDKKVFTAAIRNIIFTFLRALINQDYETALQAIHTVSPPAQQPTAPTSAAYPAVLEGEVWTADKLRAAIDPYYTGHQRICLDPGARNLRHTYIQPSEDNRTWRVQQMLVDPDEFNDWVVEFEIDLLASRERAEPVLRLVRLGPLTS